MKIGVDSVGTNVVEVLAEVAVEGGVLKTPWLLLSLERGPCSLVGEITACLFNIFRLILERIVTTRKRVETMNFPKQKHFDRGRDAHSGRIHTVGTITYVKNCGHVSIGRRKSKNRRI
jgi:hypothetical protein